MRTPELVFPFSAAQATATSPVIEMSDIAKATLVVFSAGTFLNRSGVLTADVSMDGVTWVSFQMFAPNVTNTNVQNLTHVAATTAIASTGQAAAYGIEMIFPFRYIRFILTVTDGATPTGNFTLALYKAFIETN